MSTKSTQDSRKIHILKLKMQQLWGTPSEPETPSLQTKYISKINQLRTIFSKYPQTFILTLADPGFGQGRPRNFV